MARTKKISKSSKEKSRAADPSGAADAAHSFAVILERVEAQQRVVIETLTDWRQSLKAEIEALGTKLTSRIDVLEFVVRKNSDDIRQNSADIQQNSADIQQNSADIQSLTGKLEIEAKLDTKADASRVAELERRVDALGA